MPTKCFVVADMSEGQEPGAMWPLKVHGSDDIHWCVRLPNRGIFDIHSLSSTDRKPWQVSGEPPTFTVSPSIVHLGNKLQKGWHGWLKNGVLSDDVEGRRYE